MQRFSNLTFFSVFIVSSALFMGCSTANKHVQNYNTDIEYIEVPMPDEFISFEYPKADIAAKYPGGEKGLQQHIQLNTRFPYKDFKKGVSGRVIITYVVGADGRTKNIEAVMSPSDRITKVY